MAEAKELRARMDLFQRSQITWGELRRDIEAALASLPSAGAEPVAYRYKDVRGHWRYTGSRPNFKAEYSILKPEALYAAPPAKGAEEPSCAECGKTSTKDSMWALYCVKCIQTKLAPAFAAPVQAAESAGEPTDEQILAIVKAAPALESAEAEWLHVVRAVLALASASQAERPVVPDIINTIIRDVSELEGVAMDESQALAVSVDELRVILERNLAAAPSGGTP